MKIKTLFPALAFLLILCAQSFSAPFTGELDRSFNPTPDRSTSVRVRAILVQPDGKFVIAGTFLKVNNIQVNHVARFNSDGTLDTTFDAGGTIFRNPTGDVLALALQPDGKILVGGNFESVARQLNRRRIARLNADGSFDATFNANLPTFAGAVNAIAVQPDGKILVNGASAFSTRDFGRLNADGSVDTTFTVNPTGVTSIAAQTDGKILIGGGTLTINAQARTGIARLNADGSLDTSFVNQNITGSTVNKILILPDGKIFIGGLISAVSGQTRQRLAKLNADGSLDASFGNNVNRVVNVRQIAVQSDGKVVYSGTDSPIFRDNADGSPDADFPVRSRLITSVDTVAALPDDRIVAGGNITTYNSTPPTLNQTRDQPLALLAADGTINELFRPDVVFAEGISNADILVQPDGKILFSDIPAAPNFEPRPPRRNIVRYNADGSVDNSFTFPTGILSGAASVTRLARQADGKIVFGVTGSFDKIVVRLNADGSLDSSFNVTFNGSGATSNLEIQPDGKIIIFGTFTQINGQTRAGFARLNANGSLDAFNPAFTDAQNNQVPVNSFKMQADGKFFVSGSFEKVDGIAKRKVVRFNADGAVDNSFTNTSTFFDFVAPNLLTVQPDGKLLAGSSGGIVRFNVEGSLDAGFAEVSFRRGNATSTPIAAGVLPNGKIIIGGSFTSTSTFIPRFGFARLNADGTLDAGYGVNGGVSGSDATVYRIAVQPDGKALIAGRFQYVNNISQPTLARLNASAFPGSSVSDFDGDGKSDAAVFRSGNWFINPSGSSNLNRSPQASYGVQFGLGTDKLAPADYDADGKTDIAVWRAGEFAYFYILNSSNNTFRAEQFGRTGDAVMVGNWDADNKADLAVYRSGANAGDASFFFYRPSTQPSVDFETVYWGTAGDQAVRGDFDGDGKLDAAVFRASNNIWYIRQSSNNQARYENWGAASDKRVSGDFDGDGKTDVAVFRDGLWAILQSSSNQQRYESFGQAGDVPVAGDYDGDGKTDLAVFRSGVFYIKQSGSSQSSTQTFGQTGDVPVAAAFVQ